MTRSALIVDQFDDETINIATVRAENSIETDTLFASQLLDICVDNGLDDITGAERTERNAAVAAEEAAVSVTAQQEKLNELLTPYGMRELLVDGVSGPVTRRHLCAARLGLGLDVSLTDMAAGSEEEKALMAATDIVAPFTSALNQDRWILIDRTCQVMFAGEGATSLNFVFPTSTGSEGFETRDQDQSQVFRYDPALNNGGWHNSSDYPVPVDNPLNGNMYRPLYFDGGQAIHGANNVPTTPAIQGLRPVEPVQPGRAGGLARAAGCVRSAGWHPGDRQRPGRVPRRRSDRRRHPRKRHRRHLSPALRCAPGGPGALPALPRPRCLCDRMRGRPRIRSHKSLTLPARNICVTESDVGRGFGHTNRVGDGAAAR